MIEVREAPREHYGWIAERANLIITDGFRAIEALQDRQIVGMVGYDGWTPNSCAMHVAIDKPIAIRRLRRPAFEIPFNRLGRGVALASVLSTNSASLEFTQKLGFRPLAVIQDGWDKGVGIHIFEMRREHCRWMKE